MAGARPRQAAARRVRGGGDGTRGAAADAVRLIEALERLNPTRDLWRRPSCSRATGGSCTRRPDSILGTTRARPFRPQARRILQSINAERLAAMNEEWVLGGLLKNQVPRVAPRDDGRTVDVQFKRFGIGWLRVPAPASARGVLETTYLDDALRVSRGDKGNHSCSCARARPHQVVLESFLD